MPNALILAKSAPNKSMQVMVLAAVAALAAGGGTTFWLNGQIQARQAEQTNLSAQVSSSEEIARKLQDTQNVYAQTCSEISFLDNSKSQKAFIPTLLEQLQGLANSTDLTISSLQPSPITVPIPPPPANGAKKSPPLPYDTMDINLDLVGSYGETCKFIYGLTHFPKVVSVVSVQMSPGATGPQTTGAPQVTTDLRLTAYLFPQPAEPTGAATTVQTASLPNPITATGAAVHAERSALSAQRASYQNTASAQGVLSSN